MKRNSIFSIAFLAIVCIAILNFTMAGTDTVEMRFDAVSKQCAQYVDCSQLYITGTAATTIKAQAAAALPSASLTDAAITGKLITGFVSGAGSVSAADTILEAINKLDGNVAAKEASDASLTSIAGLTYVSDSFIKLTAEDTYAVRTIAEVKSDLSLGTAAYTAATAYATSTQGSTADSALPSASFTDAAVSGKLITGFVSGAGAVAATDTILEAVNKLDGNIALKANSADASGIVKAGAYTVVADDDTANSKTIATGLSSIVSMQITVLRAGARVNSDEIITMGSGNLTISDGGATYVLTTGDVIYWIAVGAL